MRMKSMVSQLLAFSMLISLAGSLLWLTPPPLVPQFVDQCDRNQDSAPPAPIVVVGVIVSDTLVRSPVPMHSDPGYPLQLRKLLVTVENVLRGGVGGGTVEIYYFTFAGGFDGPRPFGFWEVGNRRIFSIRPEAGVLRTACDGWDGCTYGVYSGGHPHLKVDPQKPIDYALADIVLTRGEGEVNDSKFAGAVDHGGPGPPEYVIEKYRQLALTERSTIKAAACKELWLSSQDEDVSGLVSAGRITGEEGREFIRLSRISLSAMREAGCTCGMNPGGTPTCGVTSTP